MSRRITATSFVSFPLAIWLLSSPCISFAQRSPMPTDYSDAKTMLRVFAHDAEYDFAVSGSDNESRLVQSHPWVNGTFTAPSLARGYRRGGSKWDEWRQNNEVDARRLETTLKQSQKYLVLALNGEAGLVALTLAKSDEINASEVVVLDWRTLTPVHAMEAGKGRYIEDLAWEPGSSTLLMAQRMERPGLSPISLLAAIAGHQVTYTSIFLGRLDTLTGKLTEAETPLLRDLKYFPHAWLYVEREVKPPN